MEYVKLKNSEIKVSRICMGGCPLGGYGWGSVQKQELVDAVYAALNQGINFFDTADTYGLGESERLLGEAIGERRKELVIATKFGVRVENGKTFYDNSPEWIRTALQASLKRLNTDYIDLYQLHYRDGKTPMGEVVQALEKLKEKGYIRYYGLSNIHHNDEKELMPYKGSFVSFQDEYSLACRKNEGDILELADMLCLTPMTWGSLGQGVLTGKYTQDSVFGPDDRRSRDVYVNFHGEKLKKNLEIVKALRKIAFSHGKSIAACAIRFIMDYLPDSIVIAGAKRPSQIVSNTEATGWRLEEEEIQMLNSISIDSFGGVMH